MKEGLTCTYVYLQTVYVCIILISCWVNKLQVHMYVCTLPYYTVLCWLLINTFHLTTSYYHIICFTGTVVIKKILIGIL